MRGRKLIIDYFGATDTKAAAKVFAKELTKIKGKDVIRKQEALDSIYALADFLFKAGSFKTFNELLKEVDVQDTDLDLLIGFLVTCRWASKKIPYKKTFFNKVEKRAKKKKEWSADLFKELK